MLEREGERERGREEGRKKIKGEVGGRRQEVKELRLQEKEVENIREK